MKKTAKMLITSIMALTLMMSLSLTVTAAISDVNDNLPNSLIHPINETVSAPEGGTLNDVAYTSPTDTRNPDTGSSGMIIPGIVALLAVSTAAVALAGKNK